LNGRNREKEKSTLTGDNKEKKIGNAKQRNS
jgi:hypothetical protein